MSNPSHLPTTGNADYWLCLPLTRAQRWILVAVFCWVYLVIGFRWVNVPIADSGYARAWYFGDAYSGRNVQSAARYFTEHGFCHTCALPVLDYAPETSKNGTVYTHYPALPDILGGLSARIWGWQDARLLALLPLTLSLGFFWFIFFVLFQWIPDRRAAFLSGCLVVLSNYFIAWADDIHQHLYVEFGKWLFAWLMWVYYRRWSDSGQRPLGILALLAALFFVMGQLSFEPFPILAALSLGFAWVYRRNPIQWEVVLLGIVAVSSFVAHLLQNYCYFGSWQAVYNDMAGAFLQRTGGLKGNELGRPIEPMDTLLYVVLAINRVGYFFVLGAPLVLGYGWVALRRMSTPQNRLLGMGLTFFIAAYIWALVMFQHGFVHIFTGKHLALFFGLVAGPAFLLLLRELRHTWQTQRWAMLGVHSCVALFSAYLFLYNTVWQLYLQYGLLYPYFVSDEIELVPLWLEFLWP
jgi:hypothetical protein